VQELAEARGAHVVRLNTELAHEWRVTLDPGESWTVQSDQRSLSSGDCAGVWWRRPKSPDRPETVDPSSWEAVCEQWRAFFAGLASVPDPRWVSSPFAIRSAENKASQLASAALAGLSVPRTIWTNAVPAARELLAELDDQGVCKSVASAFWETDRVPYFVFARHVTSGDLPEPPQLALAPLAFQEMVVPKRDVRATVIGARVIGAVREPSMSEEPLDWRLAPEGSWRAHRLPTSIAEACVRLASDMGLRFAGIDLALGKDGHYWFVELNPNGEWGWLQAAGLPIAEALADELLLR